MQTEKQLIVKGITAGYKNKTILSKLNTPSFSVGKLTVLTGPNAAGKSTLLRVLAGLLKADGEILFNGENMLNMTPKKRAEILSFMPQSVPTDIQLSVIEAVISALKASPLDATSSQNNEGVVHRAMAILKRIGIDHLALENLSQLSGGQRQMASLARTMVRNPEILLLDEPTSALDLRHQIKVMKLARSFADDGRIVIMVLHDLNLALRWADEVLVMNKGQIISQGTPVQAITSQVIADIYGISARVEKCQRGLPHLIIDDEI